MDNVTEKNKATIKWTAVDVTIEGIVYKYRRDTGEVYDYESYRLGAPVLVGKLSMGTGPNAKYKFEKI